MSRLALLSMALLVPCAMADDLATDIAGLYKSSWKRVCAAEDCVDIQDKATVKAVLSGGYSLKIETFLNAGAMCEFEGLGTLTGNTLVAIEKDSTDCPVVATFEDGVIAVALEGEQCRQQFCPPTKGYLDGLVVVRVQAPPKRIEIATTGKSARSVEQNVPTIRDCPECPELVEVPAGSFGMGANGIDGSQKPVHTVRVAKPFLLGRTEVTQRQWNAVMALGPQEESSLAKAVASEKARQRAREDDRFRSRFATQHCSDDCPQNNVSYSATQEFIARLNKKTGKNYRLPSAAEWEYACRAGGVDTFCGGSDPRNVAWFAGNSEHTIHPVAGMQPNAWGLHDMSGNIMEWVSDCKHDNYTGAPNDGGARTSAECEMHELRGGSWRSTTLFIRPTHRNWASADFQDERVGLRVARDLP